MLESHSSTELGRGGGNSVRSGTCFTVDVAEGTIACEALSAMTVGLGMGESGRSGSWDSPSLYIPGHTDSRQVVDR
jgi:hypothetical protein